MATTKESSRQRVDTLHSDTGWRRPPAIQTGNTGLANSDLIREQSYPRAESLTANSSSVEHGHSITNSSDSKLNQQIEVSRAINNQPKNLAGIAELDQELAAIEGRVNNPRQQRTRRG